MLRQVHIIDLEAKTTGSERQIPTQLKTIKDFCVSMIGNWRRNAVDRGRRERAD